MNRKLKIELLESRNLLAGVVTLPSGDIEITGTESADLIQVSVVDSDTIRVRIGSTFQNVDIAAGKKIIVNSLGGDDYVTLSNVQHDSVIDAGDGNDYVSGGMGNDEIHGGIGNDRLNGGNGDDVLFGDAGADQLSGGAGTDAAYTDMDDILADAEFVF